MSADCSAGFSAPSALRKTNILVFDSGVGGLSILESIQQTLPGYSISYLADNGRYPYGLLAEESLIQRAEALLSTAADYCQPDIVVIACNSASTLVLPALRQRLSQPVVGVVPAIKPAAKQSISKVIGLLATPGTIAREYTDELIAEFAPDCTVVKLGSAKLVDLVEKAFAGEAIDAATLAPLLNQFQQAVDTNKLDTVVLACTHFPLAQAELAAALPDVRFWVDSSEAVAHRTAALLAEQQVKVAPSVQQLILSDGQQLPPAALASYRQHGFKQVVDLAFT